MAIRILNGRNYYGNSEDDLLVLDPRALSRARIDLGAGRDTLVINALNDFQFSQNSYSSMSGVDVLDFSRLGPGSLAVNLNNALVDQSDSNVLTVVSGVNGIDSLRASNITAGQVVIDGVGQVNLANGVNNVVSIAGGAALSVIGGTGNDTITAALAGSVLQGGLGNDVLNARAGVDNVAYASGDGADTVIGFNVGSDAIALNGFSFTSLNEILALTTDTVSGALVNFANGQSLLFSGLTRADLALAIVTNNGVVLELLPPTIQVDIGTSAAALNAMIADAEAGTTFVLAEGTHLFDAALVIARDDITLRGENADGTVLQFSFAAGSEADAIQVTGGAKTYLGLAQGGIVAGQQTVGLPPGHGLTAGDSIYIYQPNTLEYLAANGWTNVVWEDADQRPFREFIVEIDHIEGDVAFLNFAIPYAMDAGEARVFSIDMIENIALSDFAVTYDLGVANPYDFINTAPAYDGLSAIQLMGTNGASISNIDILNAASNGLSITSSTAVVVDGVTVAGAHNKGGDGNGYGVLLTESFNNSLTDLVLHDGRHSLVFSAWSAETGNTIQIADSNRDINFHGSPDVQNSVSIDHLVLDYDPAQDSSGVNSTWAAISGGGISHAATDIWGNNAIEMQYAVGSTANDTLQGTSGNDYLNAGFGYDVLRGGDGSDYLVGGTRRDVMSGGAGADTFLLRMGDDLDTISDFTFGVGGDTLIFSGNVAVTSTANLTFTQNGEDLYVRYGSNSTVILQGVALAEINAENFSFDPAGNVTNAAYFADGFIWL